MLKYILLIIMVNMSLMPASVQAAAYTLKLYDIDDRMTATITNRSYSNLVIADYTFGSDYPELDFSAYVTSGNNVLALSLFNGPAGYTYGYDFRIDGFSYAAGQCGVWNILGCDDDRYAEGLVWSREIDFVATPKHAVPEPATMSILALGSLAFNMARRRRGLAS